MKFTKKELKTALVVAEKEDIKSLAVMKYEKFLKTDYWTNVREVMHKIIGTECEVCGSELNINVHHLNYDNRGKESLNDLVCLCSGCHFIMHKKRKGMFTLEINDRTQFDKRIKIVKKIGKTFTNKDYLRILPIAQRGIWEIGQLQLLFNCSEEEVVQMYAKEIKDKLIATFAENENIESPKFYALDNLLWSLIIKDYPKISKASDDVEKRDRFIALEMVGD